MKLYPRKPIQSLSSLAQTLRIPSNIILKTTQMSDRYYKEFSKEKRKLCRINEPLKLIQKRVKENILDYIDYPNFVQGGVRGRSAITCAKIHCNKSVLIKLDIKNFFPSITSKQIFNLWRYHLHFSEEVSKILTQLTTYKGSIPQGSSTSAHLANLVLLAGDESNLYEELKIKGYKYTRYIDDIGISSEKNILPADKTAIIKMVMKFAKSNGYQINNKKTNVQGSQKQKEMLGYSLKKNSLKKSKEYIGRLIKDYKEGNISPQSLEGKLRHIGNIDPKAAIKLRKFMRISQPNSKKNYIAY